MDYIDYLIIFTSLLFYFLLFFLIYLYLDRNDNYIPITTPIINTSITNLPLDSEISVLSQTLTTIGSVFIPIPTATFNN